MTAPLLVVDGDSFAHRAFHALPRSIRRADGRPGNLLTGFTSMLVRLWEAERPRAVVVGWDTLFVATYRHELLPGYQAGREFDPELLEQLDLAPPLLEAGHVRGVDAAAGGNEAYEPTHGLCDHLLSGLAAGFVGRLEWRRIGLERTALDFVHLDAELAEQLCNLRPLEDHAH